MENKKDLKNLTPNELDGARLRVLAKVFRDNGYTVRKIAKYIPLSKSTIAELKNFRTPEHLVDFETELKEAFNLKHNEIVARALDRMLELIPKISKVADLMDVIDYLNKGVNPRNPGVNNQNPNGNFIQFNMGDAIRKSREERGLND